MHSPQEGLFCVRMCLVIQIHANGEQLPFSQLISHPSPLFWQVLYADNLGLGAWREGRAYPGALYSVLSCYLVSLMVIVTRENTSSVGFPSQRPLGVDKYISRTA